MSTEYRYPPDAESGGDSRRGFFSAICAALVAIGAAVDVALVGFPETPIPYNYPFFATLVLALVVIGLLRLTHRVVWRAVDELASIAERNRGDPLSLATDVNPDNLRLELLNVLYLGYSPVVLLVGALGGGAFMLGLMAALDVFSAYPFRLTNAAFGAAHGIFAGPAIATGYVVVRALRRYIVDIDLIDPDGVGGYRRIGNGIVTVASYGILVVTIDFVILSSVAFTEFTAFRRIVSGLYLLVVVLFLFGAIGVTSLVRRRLLTIRDRKVELMQRAFVSQEHAYWRKQDDGEGVAEAIHILAMQAMFYQLSRMDLWPINLPSLLKLGVSVGFSLLVFLVEHSGVLL